MRKMLVATTTAAALWPALASTQKSRPTSFYLNGRTYTLDFKSQVASAVAEWDGKFIAVGAIIMPVPSAKRKFGLKLMGRAVTRSAMEDPPLRAPLRGGGLFDA